MTKRDVHELRLGQIGNFRPPGSTENDLRDALRRLGVTPMPFQEDEPDDWEALIKLLRAGDFDLVLWTTTDSFAAKIGAQRQFYMLDAARRSEIPVIGYHLDRFIGLKNREETIPERPFFSVDKLYTADGGHDAEFAAYGVRNHQWMPPAISERWCKPGKFDPKFAHDIVFVGGWKHYPHEDWSYRYDLVQWASKTYGNRFMPLPARGAPRIIGEELNNVYWSAKVVLGDSCLVPNPDGSPVTHYCSDRIPETMGRGGVLLHPFVDGLTGPVFPHLYWPLNDWSALRANLDQVIAWDDDRRAEVRDLNMKAIKAQHTYTHRMRAVLADWGWE